MKAYYVVTWDFREDRAFTDYNEANALFEEKIGKVSYVEFKRVGITPLGQYASSIKIWHK